MNSLSSTIVKSAFELFHGGNSPHLGGSNDDIWGPLAHAIALHLNASRLAATYKSRAYPTLREAIVEIIPNVNRIGPLGQSGAILAIDLQAACSTTSEAPEAPPSRIDEYVTAVNESDMSASLSHHEALAYRRRDNGAIEVHPCACSSIMRPTALPLTRAPSNSVKNLSVTWQVSQPGSSRTSNQKSRTQKMLTEAELRLDLAASVERAHVDIRKRLELEKTTTAYIGTPLDTSPIFAPVEGPPLAEYSHLGSIWYFFALDAPDDLQTSNEDFEALSRELRNIIVRYWIPHFIRFAAHQADEAAQRHGEEIARMSFAHQVKALAGGIPRLVVSERTWNQVKKNPEVEKQREQLHGRPPAIVPAPEAFDVIKRLISMWSLDNDLNSIMINPENKLTLSGILNDAACSAVQLHYLASSITENIRVDSLKRYAVWYRKIVRPPTRPLFELGFDDYETETLLRARNKQSKKAAAAAFFRIAHAYFGNMLRHADKKTVATVSVDPRRNVILFENRLKKQHALAKSKYTDSASHIREHLGMKGTEALEYYARMVGWTIVTNQESVKDREMFVMELRL